MLISEEEVLLLLLLLFTSKLSSSWGRHVGSLFTNEEQKRVGPDDAVDTSAIYAGLEVHHDIKDKLPDAKWPRLVTISKCVLKRETKP